MPDFVDRLAELEDHGSAVLVTGAGAEGAHTAICREMLASTSVEPRRRVIVAPNGTLPFDARLPFERGTVPDTTVIASRSGRSAGATAGQSVPQGVDVVELDDASLSSFGLAITEAVEQVQQRHGPLEPTELRVCVDSLAPLLDLHTEQQVFAFLVVLTQYIRTVDALGHCHLPVDRTTADVRLFEPLFDAVVEVRNRHDHPQQRWHLDEGAITSPWMEI